MDSSIIDTFQSEELLKGSVVLTRIEGIRKELKYDSDGHEVSYDDLYGRLCAEVDSLAVLKLELDVVNPQQYSIQLVMATEKILDDCDRVYRKLLKFESKLRDAAGRMKKIHGEFGAWYALAAQFLLNRGDLKMSSAQIKLLSDSEFSRLVDGLDVTVSSLLNAVATLGEEIKEHKRTQLEKHKLGREQVNASWTSYMPNFDRALTKDEPGRLAEHRKVEEVEDWDDTPTKEQHLLESPVLEMPKSFEPCENDGCSAQRGHGGPHIKLVPPTIETNTGAEYIKGTFVKVGDPKPVTPVIGDSGEPAVAEIAKDWTPTPEPPPAQTPEPKKRKSRKKLTVTEDDQTLYEGEITSPVTQVITPGPKVEEIKIEELEDLGDPPQGASQWSKERLMELADAEPGGIMACSPEILAASGGDPNDTLAIHDTAMGMMASAAQAQEERRENQRSTGVMGKIEDATHSVIRNTELEALMNEPEPVATPAPATPRKKLQILSDDEDIL